MLAKRLNKGDTIGIIFPSNPLTKEKKFLLDNAIRRLKEFGFNIKLGENHLKVDRYNSSAGSQKERADDLNKMFSDENIDAIYCGHGGETANQLLPLIDFQNIKKNPKIFIGMSDIDVLHLAINKKTGLIVFNGSDPKSGRGLDLDLDYTWNSFKERMMHHKKEINPSKDRIAVRQGKASGKIIGCNISSILKLAGTEYFPDFNDTILFLESYSCGTKKIIFKLQQLKEIGVFNKVKGIIIGYIYGFEDKDMVKKNKIKFSFEDIVLDMTKEYDFPIIKTNDFGHRCPNCYIPIGAKAKMDTCDLSIRITEDFLDKR